MATKTVTLYDTYSRSLREFEPLAAGEVGMYACGPTVYDFAHIGNLRTYVFEDLLRRTLSFAGYNVRHVMNITDVGHLTSDADTGEDKMEKGARRTGLTAWQIAEKYTDAFKADLQALNIQEPTIWCRATDHIAEQIADIQTIEERGLTYTTSDGVYFDTSKLDNYGHLARLDRDGLEAGSRVELGEKRNNTDFALWKFSAPGEQRQMEWDSPWGTGFPGWHIECSAMSVKYLGPLFDIHCGGKDHIPVHHSNEIAQSEACHGTILANYWLHGYFLETDQAKMSKSSGEFLRLQSLLDRGVDPLGYRYLCLTAHYRTDLKFNWDSLKSAETALGRLRQFYFQCPKDGMPDHEWLTAFETELYQDLNSSKALAVMWSMVKSNIEPADKRATLDNMDDVLGLRLADWRPESVDVPTDVMALLQQRDHARHERDWVLADQIRDQIIELGYEIEDSPKGAKVRKK
ncbi:MAG: cysteine--tRNA ligase [Pseudomonadota bacterium]